MKNKTKRPRFKKKKAYVMLGLVLAIFSVMAVNLFNHPRGTSIIEEYPTAIEIDSTSSIFTVNHNK